jgi:hypothetical protein
MVMVAMMVLLEIGRKRAGGKTGLKSGALHIRKNQDGAAGVNPMIELL